MGATVQKTRYSKKLNMVLQDDSVARPEDEVTIVSGVGILTNGQVSVARIGNRCLIYMLQD